MVLQVFTDTGQVLMQVYAMVAQFVGVAHAGCHQNMGGANCPSAQNNLLFRADASAVPPAVGELDRLGARAVYL